ncbi:MAG: cytochrome c [Pseudomonadota bacterium]
MLRLLVVLAGIGLAVLAAGLWLTRPVTVAPTEFAGLTGDAARGETVYWAAGCASCHAEPESDDKLLLAGGHRLVSPFGTFVAPNISSDAAEGIGGWTLVDFASAVRHGTSPRGQHYYPAFPYASYAQMTSGDLTDLWAFMQTLPPSTRASEPHELGFPFNLRVSLGIWKALYGTTGWVQPADTPELERGRYLVEALAHCGECHTPRTALGGLDTSQWMAGAPNPSGEGRIPGLTPDQLDWSAVDIAYYLESGFSPDFDSAGGTMASVVENMARLSAADRAAIAAYVKALGG